MIVEDMKVDDLECAAQKLIDTYSHDLGCDLRAELVQIANFVEVFRDEEGKSKVKTFRFL